MSHFIVLALLASSPLSAQDRPSHSVAPNSQAICEHLRVSLKEAFILIRRGIRGALPTAEPLKKEELMRQLEKVNALQKSFESQCILHID